MFPPQILILLSLMYHGANYAQLKTILERTQANPLSYLVERNLPFRFGMYKSEQDVQKQVRLIYSDFDMQSDLEKEIQGLRVWTDEQRIAQEPELAILSRDFQGKRTHEAMA